MRKIETFYDKLVELDWVSTDEFSTQWLGRNKSYYRSLKARNMDASTRVLARLMDRIIEQGSRLSERSKRGALQSVATRYEALAEEVGTEIALRSLANEDVTHRVRDALLKIMQKEVGTVSSCADHMPVVIL